MDIAGAVGGPVKVITEGAGLLGKEDTAEVPGLHRVVHRITPVSALAISGNGPPVWDI